jgi:hypothetical protein
MIGGDLEVLEPIKDNDGLDHYRLSPQQHRNEFDKRGVMLCLPSHYVRKAHSRHTRTKIVRLYHRISHYRVIRDVQPGTSPISIHGRRAMSERVTYLISGYGPYATNLRHALRVCVSYFYEIRNDLHISMSRI